MARANRPSEWVTWRKRKTLTDLHLPGVYFIGRFPVAPSSLDINCQSVIYIGQTTRPLRERLQKFHYSAFDAKDGHYGGRTFSEIYFDGRPASIPRGLRVCVISVYGQEPARSALIKYLERKYIYQYVRVHGRLPTCNND